MNDPKGFVTLALKGTMVVYALNIGLVRVMNFLNPIEDWTSVDFLKDSSLFTELLLVLFLAPLIETFVFQFLIIVIVSQIPWRYSRSLALVVSAIVFAWVHGYNVNYQVVTFFTGLIFAQLFIISRERYKMGYLLVLLVHMAGNALTYIPF